MLHRRKNLDDEAGRETSTVTVDTAGPRTDEERTVLAEYSRHTIQGSTSLDYVLADVEQAIQRSEDQDRKPPEWDRIKTEIAKLRTLVDHARDGRVPIETVAVAGIRVGRLVTEAQARMWPIAAEGRILRHEKRMAARQRAVKARHESDARRARIAELRRQHDPEEHGPLVPWLAGRLKVSPRTIRRYLRK